MTESLREKFEHHVHAPPGPPLEVVGEPPRKFVLDNEPEETRRAIVALERDATPGFFADLQAVANRAFGGAVRIVRPYARLTKADVLRRGAGLPLAETFSCIRPIEGRHCGACNKCAERQRGFRDLAIPDPPAFIRRQSCTV